jgi:maltokinase
MTFEEALAVWLPAQRWFAGKGTPIAGVRVIADTTLAEGDPSLRHLILEVRQRGAGQAESTDRYQVFAGARQQLPGELRHAVIGPDGHGGTAYDGLHDPELTQPLLAAMAEGATIGTLRFASEPNAVIDTTLDGLVLTAEQSNSSVLFGEEGILKVFRRPLPGPNPDLEVPRALARLGSPHVAAPLGWIEGELDGSPAVLGILSTYLRAAADGWSLAATSVRDLYALRAGRAAEAGGDFAGEAERLGEATAEVHRDLAAAFGTEDIGSAELAAMATGMLARLEMALATVPQLAACEQLLRTAFGEVAVLDGPLPVQRIHGDYHLGQVMRTQTGWVLLDFEGEPAVPLAARRARYPALRDVAGMLRSFDYAARYQLLGHEKEQRTIAAAHDWIQRNQAAFCAGYARAGGADPAKHTTLLRALVLDKAVYEVVYEAKHRPAWLHIPLSSIAASQPRSGEPRDGGWA